MLTVAALKSAIVVAACDVQVNTWPKITVEKARTYVFAASSSQCGGQGFDPPLLHHLFSIINSQRGRWLFLPTGQNLTNLSGIQSHRLNCHSFTAFKRTHVAHRHPYI